MDNISDKIEYAAARFENEKKVYIVHIQDVRVNKDDGTIILQSFECKDVNVFDKVQMYYVKCSDCKEDCTKNHRHYEFSKANILYLGGQFYLNKSKCY